jgi:hypothetical protein
MPRNFEICALRSCVAVWQETINDKIAGMVRLAPYHGLHYSISVTSVARAMSFISRKRHRQQDHVFHQENRHRGD